jgi:predicted transcriptional regulator
MWFIDDRCRLQKIFIMRAKTTIGRAEMEVLQYILDHHPITVRQVTEQFGAGKGLVRTTILNVMERLRQKGFLARKQSGGLYQYSPRTAKADLLRRLVRDFVDTSLGGSLSPFVAYLAEEAELTDTQLAELKQIVRNLERTKP